MMYFVIIFVVFGGDIFWWYWADRLARSLPKPRLWRIAIAIFMAIQLGYLLLFFTALPVARRSHSVIPIQLAAAVYIWHMLVVPLTCATILVGMLTRLVGRLLIRPQAPAAGTGITRRLWMIRAAIAAPPVILAAVTGRSISQLGRLRVRRIDVPIANLPTLLEGLTIAHISDIHFGHFTRRVDVQNIVEMTNQLRADLVAYTGDLIDLALADLSDGIALLNNLDPRHGLVMIEGNHDLIENAGEFERRAKAAGLPILLDEAKTLNIGGQPVQFLGTRWGRGTDTGRRRASNDAIIRDSVARVAAIREEGAFPILLAHHPHAFDAAAEARIPLILSGHTHGGQLMLNEKLGAGPVMFRYWSGLYRRNESSMVVSNGTGNWFPLRINAPAEIVHITLRRV